MVVGVQNTGVRNTVLTYRYVVDRSPGCSPEATLRVLIFPRGDPFLNTEN